MSPYSEISEYGDSEREEPDDRPAGSQLSVSPYLFLPLLVHVGDTAQLMCNQRGRTSSVSLI